MSPAYGHKDFTPQKLTKYVITAEMRVFPACFMPPGQSLIAQKPHWKPIAAVNTTYLRLNRAERKG